MGITRLGRNVGWTAVSAASDLMLSAAIGIACARFMGNAAYGNLSGAIAISGVFARLITGGLGPPTIREIGRASSAEEKAGWEAAATRRITKNTILWVPIALACAAALPPEIGWPLALCAPALAASRAEARSWRLQADLNKRGEIVPDRAGQLANGLSRIALIAGNAPGWMFAAGISTGAWVRAALLARTRSGPKGETTEEKNGTLAKDSRRLLGATLAKYGLSAAPLLILTALSAEAAGDFWAATRIAGVAALPTALYFPSANAEMLSGKRHGTHLKRALAASCLAGAAMVALGPWIMALLYGPAFANAGNCASLLGLGIMAAGPAALSESALIADGRETCVTRISWLTGCAGAAIAATLWAAHPENPALAGAAAIACPQILGALTYAGMRKQGKKERI